QYNSHANDLCFGIYLKENEMKSLAKLGAVILPLALLTACSHSAEMEALQSSVDSAQSTADSALSAARNAQSTADAAQASAANAEAAAMNAQQSADEANAKIDRMFEKAMSK